MFNNWQDFERTFRTLERQANRSFFEGSMGYLEWPASTVSSDDAGFVLELEVPGVREQDIALTVENGVLSVRGERTHEPREGYRAQLQERPVGKFKRSFRLSSNVDVDGIVATLKDGVLTVRLPKRPEAQARQIAVSIS